MNKQHAAPGEVRIISGRYRGRKVPVMDHVRPTGDRVRETLFNWLMPTIRGAVCLDAFAGSGALGLEAISRGADQVLFIDEMPKVISQLKEIERAWQIPAGAMQTKQGRVPSVHLLQQKNFDIVFLDPPFGRDLIKHGLDWLLESACLAEGAKIYVETELILSTLQFNDKFSLQKEAHAGEVYYGLLEYQPKVS